jgi:hypothetical protein
VGWVACRGGESRVTLFARTADQRQRSNDVRVTMMNEVLIVSGTINGRRRFRFECSLEGEER